MNNIVFMLSRKNQHLTSFTLFFFILLNFGFVDTLQAQQRKTDFDILDIRVSEKEKRVQLLLQVKDNKRKGIVNKRELEAIEENGDERYYLEVDRFEGSSMGDQDVFSILILVDVSGSMKTENRLENAKKAIRQLIIEESAKLRSTCNFYISTFDNNISPNQQIVPENADEILKEVQLGSDTDLNRALIEKIAEFQSQPGTKVIILLSDGKDDTKRNPYYRNHDPFSQQDVFKASRSLKKKDFLIFPVGLGDKADEPFLKRLAAETPTGKDRYIHSDDAHELADIFLSLMTEAVSNYKVWLYPDDNHSNYKGEKRKLFFTWKPSGEKSKFYEAGSDTNPVEVGWNTPAKDNIFWLMNFVIGVLVVSILLGLLYFGIPLWRQREFRYRFVKRFSEKISNNQKRDPVTKIAFQSGDPVVIKCETLTSLSTWQHIGHCPKYPNCMDFAKPCNGAGAPAVGAPNDKSTFWSQKGIYKPLNWLWFGTLGGLIAWILFATAQLTFANHIVQWAENLFNQGMVNDFFSNLHYGEEVLKNVETLTEDVLVGIFVGTGLTLTLSIVEEKGNGGGIGWLRIILRTFLGSIFCALIFLGGFLLQYLVIGYPYLSGIIIWLFFGLGLGLILSFGTTIEKRRGILGGLISSAIAYQIYALTGWLIPNFELARLLGFLVFGGVLGYILAQVLIATEDFKLLLLKPTPGIEYPISKRLKNSKDIVIGTGEVDIRTKWDTTALPGHLRLFYSSHEVVTEPKGDTLINGQLITREENYKLRHNDKIQLGKSSNTEFLFIVTKTYEKKRGWSFWQKLLQRNKS